MRQTRPRKTITEQSTEEKAQNKERERVIENRI